ncbi:hypothetical protein VPH35_058234 [Triticum aestivum]|uniref:Uncharacterized protein n=1 Tax=Aegilops tauschii subsp. strangulata TaxID=200361 RepID=A0A453E2U8_AEGTS
MMPWLGMGSAGQGRVALLGKKRAPAASHSREQLNLKLISTRRVGTHHSVHHITSSLQAHLPHPPHPHPQPQPPHGDIWLTFHLHIEAPATLRLHASSYIYSRVVSLGRVKGRRSQAIGAGEEAGKRTSRRSGGSGYRQASSNDSTP